LAYVTEVSLTNPWSDCKENPPSPLVQNRQTQERQFHILRTKLV